MNGIPDRTERALELEAIEVSNGNYLVESGSSSQWYAVIEDGEEWSCGCPDHQNRGVLCKHCRSAAIRKGRGDIIEL